MISRLVLSRVLRLTVARKSILLTVIDIVGNLKRLHEDIESVALASGRSPADIRLLAVSKTFPAEYVEQAYSARQTIFGENRVQEAETKIPAMKNLGIEWHLIGPLQSNKARRSVEIFDTIQTLERPKIVHIVNRCAADFGKLLPVFVEVNIGNESQKHGVPRQGVKEFVELVDSMENLKLQGLMTIPPYHPDPERSRTYFQELSELLVELNRSRTKPLKELSMGMTHDYQVAIQEGATLLRVGTAIFGHR